MLLLLLVFNYIKDRSLSFYGKKIKRQWLIDMTSLSYQRKSECVLYLRNINFMDLKGSAFVYSLAILLSGIGFNRHIFLYICMIAVFIFFIPDLKVNESYKKIHSDLDQVLPQYVMHLSLLLEADISLYNTLFMIQTEKALKQIIGELKQDQHNKGFDLLVEISLKIHHQGLLRLSRILSQSQKYGQDELIVQLEHLSNELWKERKSRLLKRGEEASTKLILPMILSLLGVILSIVVPAIYQLYQIF